MGDNVTTKGRFAPSPSGEMHAGNIFSSLIAWLLVKLQGGSIVLRIEDLDPDRSKPQYIEKIMKDYERLGLIWDEGPFFQRDSSRFEEAFRRLESLDLVYPCFCTRAELHAASAPHAGENAVYPGTCRYMTSALRNQRISHDRHAWRIKTHLETIRFTDFFQGECSFELSRECGDFLVRRSDGVFAYQLAVVVDDARMGVTSVVRGADLLNSTPQQLYLMELLELPAPSYAHVPLFVDNAGRRLSKRHKDSEVDSLIHRYGSTEAVIGAIAYAANLLEENEPVAPETLLKYLSLEQLQSTLMGKKTIVWPAV